MAPAERHSALLHLLVLPYPAQGHLIPILDLAHHLSRRLPRHHLALTVVVTPANLPLLAHFLAATPSAAPLVLPISAADHPSLPPGVEHVRDLPRSSSPAALIRALSSLHPKIASWARTHPNPPAALLSDSFLGWTGRLADDLGVPRVAFYSSGAVEVAALDFLWRSMPAVPVGGPDEYVPLASLPSAPSFRYSHLSSIFRSYRAGDWDWEFTRDAFLANAASWGAVVNTFDALEGEYLDHLKRSYGHMRVWGVGPLAPTGATTARGGRSSIPAEEVAAWLDRCPPRSVVYVCFGSQYAMAESQRRTLAASLEASGVRFLWVVGGGAPLPEGFEKRTRSRGLVVRGWAPQVAILNHRAVGSFVTHCGWNSALEGVAAGVTLLAWPMEADQFLNARLLAEDVGVAVRVGEGAEERGAPAVDDLAKALAESVAKGGGWPEMRKRATELGVRAAKAVAEGGSSFGDFERFVQELCSRPLVVPRRNSCCTTCVVNAE